MCIALLNEASYASESLSRYLAPRLAEEQDITC